jgi:hypothetical protein
MTIIARGLIAGFAQAVGIIIEEVRIFIYF